ncbi:LOW QUALITY PROTEIN: COBRA-like protein [Parasponia andersonii]|uniref:COBRA-like protein n=1 Tax=Parasponia andersonii TaxID=3476 RepID=A0A2P5BMY2_PARAD|nr:LOW QUALITY PROTEIN: COBRA-like protein [Parasponia andersonii]
MYNFQHYHHVQTLCWVLGWTWAKKAKGPNSCGFIAENSLLQRSCRCGEFILDCR